MPRRSRHHDPSIQQPPSDEETERGRRAERFAHGIYGTIIITALLVPLEDHGATADEVVGAVVGTAFVLFLAHTYASGLGRRIAMRRAPRLSDLGAILADNLPLLFAAVVPTLVFVLAAAGAISLHTAFRAGIGYALASLCALGFIFGRMTDHRLPGSLVLGISGAGLGAAIIFLEAAVE